MKGEVFRGLGVCILTKYSILKIMATFKISSLFTVKEYKHLTSDSWKRIVYTLVLLGIKIFT